MKKALVLLLALSMVFGAFADEPVANVNVSEFSGEASVTWGVDLDTERTGFKNDAKVTMKLNLIDGGDKSSTGEGVWGEIKIKTDGDTFTKKEGNDVEFGALKIPAKIKVDTAKLHFGDNAYIGIMSGDTQVGEYKLDTAVAAEKTKNSSEGAFLATEFKGDDLDDLDDPTAGDILKMLNSVSFSGTAYQNGIVAGYGNDMFALDVDFRSAYTPKAEDDKVEYKIVAEVGTVKDGKKEVTFTDGTKKKYDANKAPAVGNVVKITTDGAIVNDSQYSNAYSFAADLSVKAVENLTLKGGYSKDLANKWDEAVTDAFYVAADYKLGLNDTFYLKPQVGYVQEFSNYELGNSSYNNAWGNLVAAVLFGWGDKADSKPGVYFLDNDDDKKVIPGFSVAFDKQLVNKKSMKMGEAEVETKGTASPMTMKISFFSGEIVENLTAAAYYETKFGATDYDYTITFDGKDPFEGSKKLETKEEVNPGFAFAAGLKYKLAAGEGSITPQFGIAMLGGYYGKPAQIDFVGDAYKGEILNLKLGAEFAGYVENTTFSVEYASKNLKADDNKGTLNFKCKIAL